MFRLRHIMHRRNIYPYTSCIGETKQQLQNRLQQHKSAVLRGDQNHSAITQHCSELGIGIDWETMELSHQKRRGIS